MKRLNNSTFTGTEALNTIDARTEPTTTNNPSYIVDKRLIDILLRNVTKWPLQDVKKDLHEIIVQAESVGQIMEQVEGYFYIHKVAALVMPEDETTDETTDEEAKPALTNEFRTNHNPNLVDRRKQHEYEEAEKARFTDDRDPTDNYNYEG